MSAFSRGLLLKPKYLPFHTNVFISQTIKTSRTPFPRSFTNSQLFRYALQKFRPLPPKTVNGAPKKSLPLKTTYQTFAESLASKSQATLLYAAPSHTMYVTFCYSTAIFCFAYAGYNFNAHYLYPPPGLNFWIPIAFGVVSFGMACFGTYMVLGPARLIKTVTAISQNQMQALAKRSWKDGPLVMEIELRKMLPVPFFPARKIYARPEDLTLNYRLYAPPADPRQAVAERMESRKKLEMEQQEERRKSIWGRPFRDANKALHKLFMAMRLVWTRESFLELAIKGTRYKLDIGGGWALDEGKALDRLVRLKAPN